jgi:two-component system LytT family response regulator
MKLQVVDDEAPIGASVPAQCARRGVLRVVDEAASGSAGVAAVDAARVADSLPASPLLVGERQHRMYLFKPERVEFIEAHGNYVSFHVTNNEYLSRDSLKRLAGALALCGFVRIERSLLVNIRAIHYAQRVGRGTYAFTLLSGACLYSGATYRDEILRVLPLAQTHPSRPVRRRDSNGASITAASLGETALRS